MFYVTEGNEEELFCGKSGMGELKAKSKFINSVECKVSKICYFVFWVEIVNGLTYCQFFVF